jgi:hypothetical protein
MRCDKGASKLPPIWPPTLDECQRSNTNNDQLKNPSLGQGLLKPNRLERRFS